MNGYAFKQRIAILFPFLLMCVFAQSPRELKEQAIVTLTNIFTTDPIVQKARDSARIFIEKSLIFKEQSLFIDGSRISAKDGAKVFINSKKAAAVLLKSIAKDTTPLSIKNSFQQIVDSLVVSDKEIADLSLKTAQAMIGVLDVNASFLGRAVGKFTSGEQEENAVKAIAFFDQSWRLSQRSVFNKLKILSVTTFNDLPDPFDPRREQSVLKASVRIEKLAVKQFLHLTQVIKDDSNKIVRTIVTNNQKPERSIDVQIQSIWDGRDEEGNIVASGNYFYVAYAQLFILKEELQVVKELSFPIVGNITVIESKLSIESVNPIQGRSLGGTIVTVNGRNFENDTKVFFGANEATNVVVSNNRLTCSTPSENIRESIVDVTVKNVNDEAVLEQAFKYVDDIFVADASAKAILVFKRNDQGDISPSRKISTGVLPGVNVPIAVSLFAEEVFVADSKEGILVFNYDDEGIVAAKRVIPRLATNTKIESPTGIAVYNNEIFFVDNRVGLLVFDINDNGDIAPKRHIPEFEKGAINTKLDNPVGITIFNDEIFIADSGSGVLVFGINDNGDVAPKRHITNEGELISAFDVAISGDELFVVDTQGGVLTYNINDNGLVNPKRRIPEDNFGGINTGLFFPDTLSVVGGEIFVGEQGGGILVFDLDDDGDVAPKRIIPDNDLGAVNTNLSLAIGIALTDENVQQVKKQTSDHKRVKINKFEFFAQETLYGIKMTWKNRSDLHDIKGFHIWRNVINTPISNNEKICHADLCEDDFHKITSMLIVSKEGLGDSYFYIDNQVFSNDKLRLYQLEYINFKGKSFFSNIRGVAHKKSSSSKSN